MGPAEQPAFWFGFEVSWAKLVLARVVVFGLLAIDALLQIPHAPRYGAGGFNVAQIPLLEAVAPGRVAYAVTQLVCAYLFVLVACGVATRIALPVVALLYGWLYFASHLDSYQHHYLVWLVLVLSCAVPWQRPRDATPATRVRSWALRLVLVQLAILYFYAAVSKLGAAWLDGRTLGGQIGGTLRALIDGTIGVRAASLAVVIVELALAATVWLPRAWWIAAPVGLAFHGGILLAGLEIGLFAELMLGLYILVIPDRVWLWLAELRPARAAREYVARASARLDGAAGWIAWVFAASVAAVLALASRFDHGALVALALTGVFVAATAALHRRVRVGATALVHLLALGTWTATDRASSAAADYFRFWGGTSRRLGDSRTAEHAYRRMTEIAPREAGGFYQLGRLLLARDATDEGLAALHRAQELEPLAARAYVAEARWLASRGRRDEALAKAREATIVDPSDAEARSLLDSLLAKP